LIKLSANGAPDAYGEDNVRKGSFFKYLPDINGSQSIVTRKTAKRKEGVAGKRSTSQADVQEKGSAQSLLPSLSSKHIGRRNSIAYLAESADTPHNYANHSSINPVHG